MTEVAIALVCCVAMFALGFGVGMIFAHWQMEYELKKQNNSENEKRRRQEDRDRILNDRPKNF